MAQTLTFDQATKLLQNVKTEIFPEVLAAMNTVAVLVEGQAKVNCGYTVGEDGPEPANLPGTPYQPCPYSKPPHETGTLSRGNHGWVSTFGNTIMANVGNNVQEYNIFVHEGTFRMPARPFLLDAVLMQRDNCRKILSAGVAKGLQRAKE